MAAQSPPDATSSAKPAPTTKDDIPIQLFNNQLKKTDEKLEAMLKVKPRLNVGLIQETRMSKEHWKEVRRYLNEKGYRLRMKRTDDAAVIISEELEEVTIDQKETLKYHIEPDLKHHINEVRIKMKIGEVRVVSAYVPSTVKEKKQFVEQLTKALEVIGPEEELIMGGDFNMVEDNNRDSVPKRHAETRPVLTSGRLAQLAAEEKLMREMVKKHCLRDVFFSNDLKTYNNIYTNITSNGEYNRRLDRIYITPRLYQSKLKFRHLAKKTALQNKAKHHQQQQQRGLCHSI
ncbi:unnamed protein product [Ambrosiozyma monospora]|uniref:Unnamed protein product n=1 Tax=Ambrosiozyma monospora TaxID=43982 RepID=A0A9W6Z423_AMBMO|nr:unnamed protein product [Ambrosiozyma monospora]